MWSQFVNHERKTIIGRQMEAILPGKVQSNAKSMDFNTGQLAMLLNHTDEN